MPLPERTMRRSCHTWDNSWTPLSWKPYWYRWIFSGTLVKLTFMVYHFFILSPRLHKSFVDDLIKAGIVSCRVALDCDDRLRFNPSFFDLPSRLIYVFMYCFQPALCNNLLSFWKYLNWLDWYESKSCVEVKNHKNWLKNHKNWLKLSEKGPKSQKNHLWHI